MRRCHCGNKIPVKYNSTIQPTKCPLCQYRDAAGTKKERPAKQKKERKKPVKWRNKPTAEMIRHVQSYIVNPYIRSRDKALWVASVSDNGPIAHAGHYYSVGAKPGMRFNPQNIHGQSVSGNMFKSGDLLNYRAGLIRRYGEAYVEELETQAMFSEGAKSLDRTAVIVIAETYLFLHKNKIWVTTLKEFIKYANMLQNEEKRNN